MILNNTREGDPILGPEELPRAEQVYAGAGKCDRVNIDVAVNV